ncbi:RHS repeat-associated core domain-containing protein, partial [Clostridium sp. A1-XYC3]
LNELIQEENELLNKTITYTYDSGGNISNRKENINGVETTISYLYETPWKDKLTHYNGNKITYDTIGNPKTYAGYTYSWEEGRRLTSIVGSDINAFFKYNDAGIRTHKRVNGVTTKFHLIGDRVTYEYTEDANHVIKDRIYYRYDNSDDLVSMNLNGVEYYYIRNGQGDIIGLIDSRGTKVVSYIYDSWGKLVSIRDEKGIDVTSNKEHVGYKNPYRYRGYRYDSETELYYLNSRYYNPEWGRYLNADVIGGQVGDLLSHNVFCYCKNDPINMYDPNGYWRSGVLSRFKAFVYAAFFVITDVVVQSLQSRSVIPAPSLPIKKPFKSKEKQSTQKPISKSTPINIPMSNRKSNKYYPAHVDYRKNTVVIDFLKPMDIAEAQIHVRGGNDVYTFTQNNARMLALTTGGNPNKIQNHINSEKSVYGGVYFYHYHSGTTRPDRGYVHIFFDLPKIKE